MTCSRLLAVAAALILPAAAMAETIEGSVDYTGKPPTPGKLHREAVAQQTLAESGWDPRDPSNISPFVAYLATESCPIAGRVMRR